MGFVTIDLMNASYGTILQSLSLHSICVAQTPNTDKKSKLALFVRICSYQLLQLMKQWIEFTLFDRLFGKALYEKRIVRSIKNSF